jgi:hypothetical protein
MLPRCHHSTALEVFVLRIQCCLCNRANWLPLRGFAFRLRITGCRLRSIADTPPFAVTRSAVRERIALLFLL